MASATNTWSPASPGPVNVTRGSAVGDCGASRVGAPGRWVSMTKVTVTAVLTFPAASCWVTEAVWVPSESVGEVQVQLPPADTVAWQTGDPDRVPENTGRFTLDGVGTGSTVGAAIEVFTTKTSGFDCGEVESPRFKVATSTWEPSGSLLETLHDHCRLET